MIFKRVRATKKMANHYKNNTVWQLLISVHCKIELKVSLKFKKEKFMENYIEYYH